MLLILVVLPLAALPECGTPTDNPAGELKIGPRSRSIGVDKQQNTCFEFAFKTTANFNDSTNPFGKEACLELGA